jgi:hypothetical protein
MGIFWVCQIIDIKGLAEFKSRINEFIQPKEGTPLETLW